MRYFLLPICSASLNVSFALLPRRTSQNAFQNAQSLFNKPYMKILTDGPSSVILHIWKKKLPLFYTLFLDHLLEHFQPSNTCLYSSPAVWINDVSLKILPFTYTSASGTWHKLCSHLNFNQSLRRCQTFFLLFFRCKPYLHRGWKIRSSKTLRRNSLCLLNVNLYLLKPSMNI